MGKIILILRETWLHIVYSCINYFSIAVIKQHDQGNLEKEGLIWPYGSIRIKLHYHLTAPGQRGYIHEVISNGYESSLIHLWDVL